MRLSSVRITLSLSLALLIGVAALTARHSVNETASAQTTVHGFDVSSLDKSANACADFYQFANGGWMKNNPIPAAYPEWGRFDVLDEMNQKVVREILEDAAKNTKAKKGTNEQKIGDYYASCMDEQRADAEGTKPLEQELARINGIKDLKGVQTEVARLSAEGVNTLFVFGSDQDYKNSKQVIAEIRQGGLSLPDRDYYFNTDDKSKNIRAEYVKHVAKMFELMGDEPAKAAAEANTVMTIETRLAEVSMDKVKRRDPDNTYHKMTLAQLQELTPHLDWKNYFKSVGVEGNPEINVAMPDFLKGLDAQLASVSLDDWKTHLRWRLLNSVASALSSKFVDEDFNFKGRILTGTTENLPRWKRCVASTDNALGEALGQVYVQKTFSPEAKARSIEMVKNLIAALQDDLSTLSWMGADTRKQAISKLNAFIRKIGYPDAWRNYEALEISRVPYVSNALNSRRFEFTRDLRKIGRPVDKMEWAMSPPTVNAYYNPQINEIVFPAGILQPPFFDPKADDAINYGGIGAVIGHEMTHGFDDQGAKFDSEGNLKNWWTDDDLKNFNSRTECVVKQFDAFEVEKGLHQNGKLVVGESVADLGGLTVAYAAFKKSLEGKQTPQPIDGFTPEQRFFLGWAQVWATNDRPEFARLMVNTNPHPLARFRVNGPLSNMPQFAAAFQCKEGDPMVRGVAERCQIW
ncbi:MAG: M13 family metallopeptidase [Pyrinomonadaceae bacterium]